MTLKDLHLYGGKSFTLFSFQANQTWAFSGLGGNSIINPKLWDIVKCTGYYLRLSFVQQSWPENRKKYMQFLSIGRWKPLGQLPSRLLWVHCDDVRGVWNYGQHRQCLLVSLKWDLFCLLLQPLICRLVSTECWSLAEDSSVTWDSWVEAGSLCRRGEYGGGSVRYFHLNGSIIPREIMYCVYVSFTLGLTEKIQTWFEWRRRISGYNYIYIFF